MQNIESSIEVEDDIPVSCVERASEQPAPEAVLPDIDLDDETSRKTVADCVHKVFNFDSTCLTDVDKFKRRLIRSIARSRFVDKIPETEMWEKLRKDTDCDCLVLVKRMRALTLKKLKRLLTAEDLSENITKVARLTMTDWLLFDLLLVHESVDLTGTDSKSENPEEPKVLCELFELVTKYKIESIKRKPDLIKAWLLLTLEYNTRGRQCSPMLLQRRWYQMKQMARLKFYTFWYSYRGMVGRLQQSWAVRPSELHTRIAKRFPKIVVEPFPEWEELIASDEVILREDFENLALAEPLSNKNAEDVQIIETPVETIQIDEDSDAEDVATSCQTQEHGVDAKLGTDAALKLNDGELGVRIVSIKTEKADNVAYNTPADREENETCLSLDAEKINEVASGSPCSDNVCNDDNELLPKITNVTGGVEVLESDDESDIVTQQDLFKVSSEAKTGEMTTEAYTSNDRDNSGDVSNNGSKSDRNEITDRSNDKKEFEVHLDDLIILDDGIALEDDSTEENECKDNIKQMKTELEQPAENADKEDDTPKFDFKLLLTPVVYTKKLDDMDVFKFIDFMKVRDTRIIECSYKESKPIHIKVNQKPTKDLVNTKEDEKVTQNTFDHSQSKHIELNKSDSYKNISDHQRVKYSSWLLQKPKNRSYNPILLCKNPDFNTRLKRLNAGFFISERNRLLLKECKRLTVDLHKCFENKLIDGTLYLKNSKFTHDCEDNYSQKVTAYPVVEPRTVQIDRSKVNLLNETFVKHENTQNVTKIEKKIHPASFEGYHESDFKETKRMKLLVAEISPIAANKIPPVEIVDSETKGTKLNQEINFNATELILQAYGKHSNVKEARKMKTNENVQLDPKSFKLDASGTDSYSKNIIIDKMEVQDNTQPDVPGQKKNNTDSCGTNLSVEKGNNQTKIVQEKNKFIELEQKKTNENSFVVNSCEESVDNDIEICEMEPKTLKRATKQLSKSQIDKSLKKIFMKAPINYRCPTSVPRTPIKWDATSKSSQCTNINISDAYGDALLATSTLEKMIKVLSHQPIDNKLKKHKRKVILKTLEEQKIRGRKKQGNKIKAQNIEKKTSDTTIKTSEEINNENSVSEVNAKGNNDNNDIGTEKDKSKEQNSDHASNNKKRYCCWALEKLLTNKNPKSLHYCPQPVCICCCRDRLLERTLQEKVTKAPQTKKRTLPIATANKPPIKKHKATNINNENQKSVDIVQIILSDDDDNDGDKNSEKSSNSDEVDRVDPNKNENLTPPSNLQEFTNHLPKESNNVESLPDQDITSSIQTTNVNWTISSSKPRNSSFTQTCKTRVIAQNSRISNKTSMSVELPPLRVNSSVNGQTYKPAMTSYFIQPNNTNMTLSNGKTDPSEYNVLSHCNESAKPIYLGKNKILLCSTNKSESTMPESSPQEDNSSSEGAQSLLPPGVQIILLPTGELALSIQPGLEFNSDEIAKLSDILTSVQQHLTTSADLTFLRDILKTTGAETEKEGNCDIISHNKNILEIDSNDSESPEKHLTSSIASNENFENISQELNVGGNLNKDSQGFETSNDIDSHNSKKSILSDLMEMSGISEKDTVSEAKTLSIPKKYPETTINPLPPQTAPKQTDLKTYSLSKSGLKPVVCTSQETHKELSIVSSFDELKKCHEKSCQFYKMDVQTGQILPINLKIKKKSLDHSTKSRQAKMCATGGPSRCVIDLTEDQGDEVEEISDPKAVEKGNIKPIKLIRSIHSTGLNAKRTIILQPLRQNKLQDPSKLVSILRTKRSLLKKHTDGGKKLSASKIIRTIENKDTMNAINDENDSDSDDEPLAKKALRKRDGDETAINTESTESPDVSGSLENVNDAIECYTPQFLEPELFEDNDEDGDCILGV